MHQGLAAAFAVSGKPRWHTVSDPMERAIAKALDEACLPYTMDGERGHPEGNLDFWVPALDCFIEVKQFHTDRIADQMSRQPNIIAVQGENAVHAFCRLLALVNRPPPEPSE